MNNNDIKKISINVYLPSFELDYKKYLKIFHFSLLRWLLNYEIFHLIDLRSFFFKKQKIKINDYNSYFVHRMEHLK